MDKFAPLITLNNGVRMPALGLGLFLAHAAQTARAWNRDRRGLPALDTAAAYLNERAVGEGIRRSGIDRSELFVTSQAVGHAVRL